MKSFEHLFASAAFASEHIEVGHYVQWYNPDDLCYHQGTAAIVYDDRVEVDFVVTAGLLQQKTTRRTVVKTALTRITSKPEPPSFIERLQSPLSP